MHLSEFDDRLVVRLEIVIDVPTMRAALEQGSYVPIGQGLLYLVAIIDRASRAVLAWRLSNTMDTSFCVSALEEALARFGRPEIFNTEPGQPVYQCRLHRHAGRHRRQDLDGRSRALDGHASEKLGQRCALPASPQLQQQQATVA
jgi:putative transposase